MSLPLMSLMWEYYFFTILLSSRILQGCSVVCLSVVIFDHNFKLERQLIIYLCGGKIDHYLFLIKL